MDWSQANSGDQRTVFPGGKGLNENMEQGFGKGLMDDVDKEFWSSQGVGSAQHVTTMKKWFLFSAVLGLEPRASHTS